MLPWRRAATHHSHTHIACPRVLRALQIQQPQRLHAGTWELLAALEMTLGCLVGSQAVLRGPPNLTKEERQEAKAAAGAAEGEANGEDKAAAGEEDKEKEEKEGDKDEDEDSDDDPLGLDMDSEEDELDDEMQVRCGAGRERVRWAGHKE